MHPLETWDFVYGQNTEESFLIRIKKNRGSAAILPNYTHTVKQGITKKRIGI